MQQGSFAAIAGLALGLGLIAAPAEAALRNRTFVSGNGLDTNPCSIAQPCRTFAFALTQTAPGGGITVLDPANYSPVVIDKAVSIINDGIGEASIQTTTATEGIKLATSAGDVVNLIGLTLVGLGTGTDGIQFGTVGTLNIQNCRIGGFTGFGIHFQPTANADANISDTIVSDNNIGILIKTSPGSSTVSAALNRVEVNNSVSDGVGVDGSLSTGVLGVTIADSIANHNGGTGFVVRSTAAHAATTLVVTDSQAVNNNITGGSAGAGASGANATLLIGRSIISGNSGGWFVSGGTLNSYGDNYVNGNAGSEGVMPTVGRK